MNWNSIVRCTAIAAGAAFLICAMIYLATGLIIM
jgi:hypothetical protein